MRFSKQQQQFESFLTDKLKGKVKLYATVHRKAHDQPSKLWITYHQQEILRTDDLAFQVYVNRQYEEKTVNLARIPYNENWAIMMQLEERQALVNISDQIEQEAVAQGLYPAWWFYQALAIFYTLSIEDALCHEHPIVQALAMLDRRLGKRKLTILKPQHPLVEKFHALRCEVEGIRVLYSS
ncbi:nonribosomal peptide synthetase [Metasolibacillus meyeri]|uniref:Nonribosomal peptide synthetase n=1 Tax=Metasolibacillus meyeri TaxID=1071052 RepID=A0AAW9NJF8_9BACL|nr:nonribosomal peptide synthetase [Metasolibacillus meyeri]MEC1177217.1 nonribosomal peptide synthetase [Metasolibacillus meyeri]